ncbi:MAG: hypothetical protein CMK96_06290 [Pseudomonas sp.]|nr:hypothetical protein [Pseudomonas sp.]
MTETSTEALYEGPCEAGCRYYHGGEVRHTPGCGHYPNSLTKVFEDQIAALEVEAQRLREALEAAAASLTEISDVCWDNRGIEAMQRAIDEAFCLATSAEQSACSALTTRNPDGPKA